ncbi:hypothetical protein FNV43_RR05752 [Rhamnella rubrinervis]|uniref:Uncharacterized protein n=1 Tax=Rhamnella rubrinervis TaxID=2594499 RepID=A0A8K0HN78_9ROSA|nr:hypothetical protein FNV43_RR05752 [Rhamnella rubrinervis]
MAPLPAADVSVAFPYRGVILSSYRSVTEYVESDLEVHIAIHLTVGIVMISEALRVEAEGRLVYLKLGYNHEVKLHVPLSL